jgi:hypothetical protein
MPTTNCRLPTDFTANFLILAPNSALKGQLPTAGCQLPTDFTAYFFTFAQHLEITN